MVMSAAGLHRELRCWLAHSTQLIKGRRVILYIITRIRNLHNHSHQYFFGFCSAWLRGGALPGPLAGLGAAGSGCQLRAGARAHRAGDPVRHGGDVHLGLPTYPLRSAAGMSARDSHRQLSTDPLVPSTRAAHGRRDRPVFQRLPLGHRLGNARVGLSGQLHAATRTSGSV